MGGAAGGYFQLAGLTYHKTGWQKSPGRTKEQCEALCNKAGSCKILAYRKRDNLCMLSAHSLGENEHWNFYEKEGIGKSSTGFADRPVSTTSVDAHLPGTPTALKIQISQEQTKLAQEQQEVAAAKREVKE